MEVLPNQKGEIKHCFCGHVDLSLTLLNILWIHIWDHQQLGNRPPNQRPSGDLALLTFFLLIFLFL